MKAFIYKGFGDFWKRTRTLPVRLFARSWYHWLLKIKRGGLKAKFEGLNFPELLK
jgi:hypothetical protein